MKSRVRLTARAWDQLHEAARWYSAHDADVGREWLSDFLTKMNSLTANPEGQGIARESDLFPFELRELLYGSGRKKTHRALFRIADDEVVVVAIRHMAQDDLKPSDLE